MKARILTAALTAASIAGLALASAGPAAAAIPHTAGQVTATTRMTNRPDSGSAGNNWALDNFTRVATITSQGSADASNCGGASPCYAYGASLADGQYLTGSFTTIKGQLTPNQSGQYAGETIINTVSGGMSGTGGFATFYSTTTPDAALVPTSVNGSADPSYLWPALFFPAGTTFGINEVTFDYNYSILGFGIIVKTQHWEDADFNGDGGLPADGNITGA